MVSPQKIKYNGVFSDIGLGDLDIILDVAFDSDNGAMSSYLNRSAVASESHDGRYKNTHRYKFDELFSPQFTIVKKNFSDFTQDEIRRVLKYLTSTDKPALLEVYYDGASNVVDWACIGGWTSIETYKLANSRTVGIVATFEAITPYAMSDLYTVTKTISTATDHKITIEIDTDEPQSAVCPRVTIQHDGSNFVRIADGTSLNFNSQMLPNTAYFNGSTFYWKPSVANLRTSTTMPTTDYNKNWIVKVATKAPTMKEMEDQTIYLYGGTYYWIDPPYTFRSSTTNPNLETTSVKFVNTHYDYFNVPKVLDAVAVQNNTLDEKIMLDGANKIVSSTNTRRIFGDDFVDWRWLELYDGKNEIAVEGNCTVTLEYREIRKVGEY